MSDESFALLQHYADVGLIDRLQSAVASESVAADECEKCGHVLQVGDFPFCPHASGSQAIVSDDIPGGQWFENGFKTPRKFYSHSEHRAALAAEGKEIAAKWVPGDKHLTRWDSVDLDGAAALTMRGVQARAEKRALDEEFPITVTDVTFAQEA